MPCSMRQMKTRMKMKMGLNSRMDPTTSQMKTRMKMKMILDSRMDPTTSHMKTRMRMQMKTTWKTSHPKIPRVSLWVRLNLDVLYYWIYWV